MLLRGRARILSVPWARFSSVGRSMLTPIDGDPPPLLVETLPTEDEEAASVLLPLPNVSDRRGDVPYYPVSSFLAGADAVLRGRQTPSDALQSEACQYYVSLLKRMTANAITVPQERTRVDVALRVLGMPDAFSLLVRLGIYEPSSVPSLHSGEVASSFNSSLIAASDAMCRDARDRAAEILGHRLRRDLRHLTVYTIDDASTQETDDGLSIERRADGSLWIHVHVADPVAYLSPGSPLDLEARRRVSTFYMPEGKVTMFPASLAFDLFSIEPNKPGGCAVFTVSAKLGSDGEVLDCVIGPALVDRVVKLDYEQASALLRSDASAADERVKDLVEMKQFADAHLERRHAQGGFQLNLPEPIFKRSADGASFDISADMDFSSESRALVSELMIMSGRLAATCGNAAGVAMPYRTQPRSFVPEDIMRGVVAASRAKTPGIEEAARILPFMLPSKTSTVAGSHWALGVKMYAKVTSPIRRYSDILAHYQLWAVASGEKAPFGVEEMADILTPLAIRERVLDRLQGTAERYWILRFIERQDPLKRYRCTVMSPADDAGFVQAVMLDTAMRCRVRVNAAVALGDTITAIVNRLNPRRMHLVLTQVDGA